MYKNGKLTAAARAKLEKRYAKERKKDSILTKIDKKEKRKAKKRNSNAKKTTITTTNTISGKNRCPSRQNINTTEKNFQEPDNTYIPDNVSECPSTPPRNDMVKEREMIMKANKGVNWVSLIGHNQAVANAETTLYSDLTVKAKKDFKLDLERQMKVREDIREKERQGVLAYQKEQQDLYKSWDGEAEEKAKKIHDKVQVLKKMREEQIVELEAKREKLYKKELRREIRQAKKNEIERQQYEQDIIDRKVKKHAEMQQVLVENAKYKAIALEEEKKIAQEEIELQRQYAEILKKQEEARSKALEKMFAQAEEKAGNLLDFTEQERRADQEFEEKCARELEKRLAAQDEKQRLKNERLAKENLEVQAYLKEQIRVKEEKLRVKIVQDREWGRKMNEAAVKSLEEDVEKVEERKRKLYEQADYIKAQIRENEEERILKRADMTKQEKDMNMSLIRQVQDGEIGVKEMPFDPKKPFAWRYNYRAKPF